ncbi:MAG: hypothetical protein ACFHU9_06440 [Fluviicola sp.]
MKTIQTLVALLLFGFLASCSLNGKQEASLNSARMAYIEARNTNNVSLLIKLTYADAVRYYQSKGDEVFKERFRPENNQAFYRNGSVVEVVSEGAVIHVKYEFEKIIEDPTTIELKRVNLYAISVDDGKHWKFLDGIEYNNPEIVPENKKLISN